jgi:hypothetical protein
MSFLGVLADQISSQFSLGENTNHSLDTIDPQTGKTEKYGSLGDFANKFDQSAERRYVEEGYLRKDPYNTDPKQFEVLFQEPNATVFIKKKMFSSVADNFRPDFMDKDEALYYKASKILFQNKCNQIAALEKLSKIQKITSAMGNVADQLVPIIISAADSLNSELSSGSNLDSAFGGSNNPLNNNASDFSKVVDRLRRIYAFNTTSPVTSWITDNTDMFQSQFGQGTGVIEITNFTSLNTNTTVDLSSGGNFSLNISDPYESMLITEFDIEKAISDATNMFYNSKLFQFGQESSAKLINDLSFRLNQIRSKRGAGPITIKVDPNTLLGKRVTAIFDRVGLELPFDYNTTSAASIFSGGAFGGSTTIPPEYFRGGEIAGEEGLDSQQVSFSNIINQASGSGGLISGDNTHLGPDSEVSIFNRLISTIYSKLSLDANSQNSFQTLNKNTNYTRKKMRFNFSGKLIIQSMDVVHIYIGSKSRYDNKLLSGLQGMFSGLGMMQNLNNSLTGITNSFNTLFNPSGDVPLQIEKAAYVGADFPNYLWSMIRNQFVTEKEGTHVFGGVVDNAVDSWSDGRFTVEVRGRDNTAYFEQGKVNFKPGVDVFNGAIFDPLTPFKSNFDVINSNAKDETPVLLDENQYLLGVTGAERKSLIKHKLGRYAGQLVTGENIIQDRSIDPVTGRITQVFYAPDGLVYKWKEGIGVFTQFGSNLDMNDPNKVGNPNIAKEPFAGQDIMNVISLLITGQPYNFATYFKATQELGGFGRDPSSHQDAAHSYIQSLRTDLIRSNTLWGNFVPFKNLVMDEASYVKALSTQTTILQFDQKLDDKIKELQDLNKQAVLLGAVNALSDTSKFSSPNFPDLKSQVTEKQKQVNDIILSIQKENSAYKQATGQDISYESTDFIDPQKIGASVSDASLRRYLRRQLNYLTRRMSYTVRGNEDKNLFIVDDFYDKDFDIMAYEKDLTDGIKLYNSEFTSVKEKIVATSQLLNLEVFCDSQGHIRCRPPAYNRMPSSVFYRMMYLKQSLNIQVFPQFLDDLFNTKLDTLRTRIEIIEDQIRLDCAILGHKASMDSDNDAQFFIITSSQAPSGTYAFLSDPDSGLITEIQDLMTAANPDEQNKSKPQALTVFGNLQDQATSTNDVFSNTRKYSTLLSSLTKQKDGITDLSVEYFTNNAIIDKLTTRIKTKSGQSVNTSDYLVKTADQSIELAVPTNLSVDVFKVISELVDKIQERQKVLRLFYSTIKNAQELKSLDDTDDQTSNQLLTPGIFGNSNIPEVFEHMIEDETFDDYGLDSGKRFVIKRAQIKSLSISENPPPWTTVEVHGILNPFASNAVPEGLNSFPGGGNGLVTALAIDYDMWRNYGFKEPAVITAPFLSDPVSQCGPYASMLLTRNRKNILRGTVTISGNEYQQPGEVVFLEDRGLLFYVNSVRHNFTFAQGFTTSLELTYGHTPGEYIPTVVDMIGKLIYNNKDVADLVVQRQDTSGNEISVGVVQLSASPSQDNKDKALNIGLDSDSPPSSFSAANAQVINNLLYTTAYQIVANNTQGNNNVTANIELRVYYDGNNAADKDILKFANNIRDILIGMNVQGLNSVTVSNQGTVAKPLPPDNVKKPEDTTVNLDATTDRRSPSQKAISAARSQVALRGTGTGQTKSGGDDDSSIQNDKLRNALFKYIVDCWIIIEPTTQDNRC